VKSLVHFLSGAARRAPVFIIVVVLIATALLGALNSQMVRETGQEGFAPDTPEIQASERIGDLFASGASEEVIQVIVKGEDVISASGLRAVQEINRVVAESQAGAYLSNQPQRPGVVSFLDGVLGSVAQQGIPTEGLTDADVKQLYQQAVEFAPPEQSGFLAQLASQNADLTVPSAPAGLAIVFLDASQFSDGDEAFSELIDLEVELGKALSAIEAGDGISVAPFSFALLFGEDTDFLAEVGRLFLFAIAIILAILGFVYFLRPKGSLTLVGALRRSAADIVLTMGVILMAITWEQGIGVLLGPGYLEVIGPFNEIGQIIPILLVGLGVDYAIHLTARYREELGEGRSVEEATGRAISTVGVALILATVTTAVGFLTNVFNPVPALADFGILSAVGILSAFVLMLTFVPAVRLLLDRRAERAGRLPSAALAAGATERFLPKLMARTAVLAEHAAIPTLIISLLLGGVGYFGLTQLSTEFSFTDFLPEDSPAVTTFNTLAEEFGGGFGESTAVLIEGDVATPDAYNAMLDAWRNLADTENVSTFGEFAQAQSPVSVVATLLQPTAESAGQPASPEFAGVAFANGLQEDLSVAADADVEAIYEAALAADPDQMGQVLSGLPGSFNAAQFTIQTSAGETGAVALQADLDIDFAPVTDTGLGVIATSQEIISSVIIQSLSDSQVRSLFITLIAAMLLLVVNFWFESRRPFLGVITILPVALVVLWTFGMMAATGIPFNPVTATLSALAIGIGVPFTIHVTHRFQEDRVRFDDLDEAIRSTARHTGGALAGSAFTTMAGFGVLITSSLKPFAQMGQVTVYAIGFALIASVLVLPSMLALWDGWHRRRGDAILDRAALEATELVQN
jgi:hydrophobe/amphiphile efflux-3 (HAE3) family protein